MNPTTYIVVAQLLIGLTLGIILLMAWRTVDRSPHALTWSIAFFVATLNGIINVISDVFPSRDLYWITVNATSFVAATLVYQGFRQRALLPANPRYLLAAVLVAEAFVIWFTVGLEHVGLRMVVSPYFGALAMAASAWVVLRVDRKLCAAEWGAFAVLLLHAVTLISAGTVALMQGSSANTSLLNLYGQIILFALPATSAGLGLFAVFLVASDLSERMKVLAITDELTGIMNRRGFEDAARRTFAHARRNDELLSVVLADIDQFKSVNDRFGHSSRDQAIKLFAQHLAHTLRAGDIVGRIGGEEFALVLPSTNLAEARVITERTRQKLESARFTIGDETLALTASFGVASLETGHPTLSDALNSADRALHDAKRLGRNRVEVYDTDPVKP